ncbi:choice-of-anchor J domain-containing protein [Flavobacterium suncheonense]|nr:choice-of-anchor J domain-containing protein [Flavobacterium suncheonense]
MLAATAGLLTSCVNEDDFDIPPVKELILAEGFETTTTGSGSNEVPIALEGWTNYNRTATRKWHSRIFSDNKYAEFSSFYSDAGTNDEVWLISPAMDLSSTANELFSFETKIRFWAGACLTVFVSEDFDGTPDGIATATWTELNPTLPGSGQEDVFVNSGDLDLSSFNSSNVRVAFKYTGSKQTGVTTTYQLDNIKVFEN